MKRIFFSLFVLVLIVPKFAFASWWNPFTWFNMINEEQEKTVSTPADSEATPLRPIITKFYINSDNSRARNCASSECKVIGYYKLNDDISWTSTTTVNISDLPEWIEIHTPDKKTVYINRAVLSESKITPQINIVQKSTIAKRPNESTQADNMVVTTIDRIISDDYQAIASIKYSVKSLNDSIELFTKFRDQMENTVTNAPQSVLIGDKYTKITEIFIDEANKDISYFSGVLTIFNNASNYYSNDIDDVTNSRKTFANLNLDKDSELQNTKIFFNHLNENQKFYFELQDNMQTALAYKDKRTSDYKDALTIVMQILNDDKTRFSNMKLPAIAEPVTPTIPLLPFPKTTHCNISPIGGGGVDLVVNCY